MSSPQGSIALQVNGRYEQVMLSSPRKQIEEVLPVIEALLQKFTIKLADLDYLLLSVGPGSFTGLRVSLGIVQGLTLGLDILVVAISSLNILAQTTHRKLGAEKVLCCVNAFMQRVYLGRYFLNPQGQMVPSQNDEIITPSDVPLVHGQTTMIAGDGWQLYPNLLAKNSTLTASEAALYPEAQDILILAEAAIDSNVAQSIDQVTLNYLRDKSAWQKAS